MKPLHPIVKIPTKTYLKKFVLSEIGNKPVTPGDHPIQKFLFIILEKKIYEKYNFKSLNTQYDDSLPISISMDTWYKMGYSIAPKNIVMFNDYVEGLFDEALYKFCSDYMRYHQALQASVQEVMQMYNIKPRRTHLRNWFQVPKYKDALLEFAKRYNLEVEEDLSFELLKKMEYRARKRFEEINIVQTVPKITETSLTFNFS